MRRLRNKVMTRILPIFVCTMLVATATEAYTQESETPDAGLKYDPNNPGAFRTEDDAHAAASKKRKEAYEKAKAAALEKAKANARDRTKLMKDLAAAGDPDAQKMLAQMAAAGTAPDKPPPTGPAPGVPPTGPTAPKTPAATTTTNPNN